MTTVRHVAPARMLGNTLTLLLTLNIMCTTSGQGQLTSTTRTVTTTQRPSTRINTATSGITRTIRATSGVGTPSTTRTQTTIGANVNSLTTTLSRVSSTVPRTTQRSNASTNIGPVEATSVQSTPLTTSVPDILVSQDVFIVCSNQYSFVFGPATTTGSTTAARTMTAVTTRAVTGTSRQVTSSRITTSTPTGAVTTRAATGTTMRATSSFSLTFTPSTEVLYAAALVVPIARVANISNASRVANVSVFGESITNRLVIQLTILDGTMPSTAEAIRNLRRLIQPTNTTNTKRRKRQSSASSSSLMDVYNQTLIPVLIVSWTATGPCPNESCRNGGVCRGRTDGNLTCDCLSNEPMAQPLCDVLPTNVTVEPWSCRQDVKCIVPAIVVPIAGVILIIVAGVVVFLVVRKCRRKSGELNSAPPVHVKDGGSTKKERKTKQIDRRTITSLNAAAFENAIYNSTENERPDFMPLQPLEAPLSSFEVNTLTKAESRSRFKKAKRESKATNGRATARHSQGDASTMRKSNVMVVGEDEGSTTSLNRDSGVASREYGSVHEYGSPKEVDGSGTISSGSASTFDIPPDGDVVVNTEIMY